MTQTIETWLIATLKGGVRKSTTAMMLAFALAADGDETLVIDADAKTQGVTDWATRVYAADGELPFHVVQYAPSEGLLVPFTQAACRRTGARRVIIDVGGELPEIVQQAVLIANLVISPVGAEQAEIARLAPTRAIVTPAGKPQYVALTRVPDPHRGAAREARAALTADGYEVLRTETRRDLELYGHVWGTVPTEFGAYAEMVKEIEEL